MLAIESEKRHQIMQAALEIISEQGFHGAPMSAIARNAGVAAGTIYRYFDNKDILIRELYLELKEEIRAVVVEGYPAEKTLRERFLFLFRELFRYFVNYPLHYRYMEQYFYSPYGITLRRDKALGNPESDDIMYDILLEGTEAGILKDMPPGILHALAFGPLIVVMRDHVFGFVALDEKLIQSIAEACWDAVER